MHCYKIIIIIIIIIIAKAKISHSSNYFPLDNFCFSLNKWHYRVLLIQLLRILCPWQKIKKKLVKSHSLTSKLSTIKKTCYVIE